MRRHLLVTNDFPPKVGGIQNYLYELWRRLPPDRFEVLTTPHDGDRAFDEAQPFVVHRWREPVLLPHPGVVRAVRRLARDLDAELVILDPALPLGAIGPHLGLPYAVIAHGAEVAVPGRLPLSGALLGRILRRADLVIAGGSYPHAEAVRAAGRKLPTVLVPPGVDVDRFMPLDEAERDAVRADLGLPDGAPLLHAGSRLVPRKGIDVVIAAASRLVDRHPGLHVAVTGTGRDRRRLELIAAAGRVPVSFCGRVPDDALAGLYSAADVFSMLCRVRWGGLEQEGFGMVFLEAAAAGTPQVAGASGGAHDAVIDGRTGLVVDRPGDADAAAAALGALLDDPDLRRRLGAAARAHACEQSHDHQAARLEAGLARR